MLALSCRVVSWGAWLLRCVVTTAAGFCCCLACHAQAKRTTNPCVGTDSVLSPPLQDLCGTSLDGRIALILKSVVGERRGEETDVRTIVAGTGLRCSCIFRRLAVTGRDGAKGFPANATKAASVLRPSVSKWDGRSFVARVEHGGSNINMSCRALEEGWHFLTLRGGGV